MTGAARSCVTLTVTKACRREARPAPGQALGAVAAGEEEEEQSYEYGSTRYLRLCGLGGMLSCGLTHTAIMPLDLVKCRMQADPGKYKGILSGFRATVREDWLCGLARGWAPSLLGYSLQGLFKFGLYEVFKIRYSELLGPQGAYEWRTSLYLAASASAEFFAYVALAPMEAVKVRMQMLPGFARTRMYAEEGAWAFYKGVARLWLRQIPYTMMKFACFQRTVEAL